MIAITCPACKSRGPFSAIRHIAQSRDLVNEDGEQLDPHDYGAEWEFANLLSDRLWINCGACGHGWRTRRDIDD